MKAHRKLYQSYLLRIWREGYDLDWRASLQDIGTGEAQNFANLSGLLEFLQCQAEQGFLPLNQGARRGDTRIMKE